MASRIRCPTCGGAELEPAQNRRQRCPKCGSEYTRRTAWLPFLLTWAVVGAVVGLASAALFASLELERGMGWWLIFGAITGIVATLLSRRFQRLQKS